MKAHLEKLNPEQRAAVETTEGPVLILAGAGSGKTRVITSRIVWLIEHHHVAPDSILAVTFTNKAAKEMAERVERLLGHPTLAQPLISTFHSLCVRLLRRDINVLQVNGKGLTRDFAIYDENDQQSLLKPIMKRMGLDTKQLTPRTVLGRISWAKNHMVDPQEYYLSSSDANSERIAQLYKAFQEELRKNNAMDFDDLLLEAVRMLKVSADVRAHYQRRFRYILVDEYQDTNRPQYELMKLLAGETKNVCAVGDEDQSIYSWRGADFENIMTFPNRHPGTVIHRIETNYRSTPEILALANGVLLAQPKGRHFDKELRAARGHAQKPFLVQTMDDREQAEFILKRIRALVEDEGVAMNEIAILYRSHFLALEVQVALSRAGIPYHITSGVKFFERQHIRDAIALLRFVYNPSDVTAWSRVAVLLPKIGEKGAQKIYAAAYDSARLLQKDFLDVLPTDDVKSKVAKDARDDWQNFCDSLKQVSEVMRTGKPSEAVETAIDGWYGDYLKGAFADYVDRLDELKALIGFASRFDEMQDFLAQIMLLNSETSDRSVDPDADAVKLTTVHQAKGLEYDVVFLIGLADGQFPGRRSIEAGDVEEERRLFYVAVTRARNELYLSYPKIASRAGPGGMMLTPSRFILELPTDLYEPLKIKRTYAW